MARPIPSDDTYLSYIAVDAGFDAVWPVVVAVMRSMTGPVAVTDPDDRWAWEVLRDETERLRGKGRTLQGFPGTIVAGAGPDLTLINVVWWQNIGLAASALMPDNTVMAIESVYDTKRREYHWLDVARGGAYSRRVCASIGTRTSGWHWLDEGEPTIWEDPSRYTARHARERMTRSELLEVMRRFGIDVAAVRAGTKRQATIRHVSFDDPEALDLESRDFMDLSEDLLARGFGDALNLRCIADQLKDWAEYIKDQPELQ